MINHRLAITQQLVRLVVGLRLREAGRGLDAGEATMLARYLAEVRRRRVALGHKPNYRPYSY